MSPESELLLFTASRAQLTRACIQPAIDAGQVVLCDRFMDSTTVYQGVARAIDSESVATINQFAVGNTRPQLTILIDLPPEAGLERVRARSNGQLDRMEQEAIEFFQAVRAGYLKLAESEPERFLVLDGSQSIETLQARILAAIEPAPVSVREAARVLCGSAETPFLEPASAITRGLRNHGYLVPVRIIHNALRAIAEGKE